MSAIQASTPFSLLASNVTLQRHDGDEVTGTPFQTFLQQPSPTPTERDMSGPVNVAQANASDVLRTTEKVQAESQRPYSFSFAELGMFGLHAAQSSTTLALEASQGDAATVEGTIPEGSPRLSSPARTAFGVPALAVTPDHGAGSTYAGLLDKMIRLNVPVVSDLATASAPSRMPVPSGPMVEVGDTAAPANVAARRFEMRPAPVNLVVTENEGGLVLLARSANASTTDKEKLRQLFEDTAWEFGLNIAELHVNGSHFGSSLDQIAGGTNGSQSG